MRWERRERELRIVLVLERGLLTRIDDREAMCINEEQILDTHTRGVGKSSFEDEDDDEYENDMRLGLLTLNGLN
jgi:hypothetical protein